MFNIYYLNYNKAFEIAMLSSNEIISFEETEETSGHTKRRDINVDITTEGSIKVPWLSKFTASLKATGSAGSENNNVQRVKRNVQIVQSSSVLLEQVLNLVIPLKQNKLVELSEGSLIKIDNIELKIENETDVRTAKMIQPGVFQEMEGLNIEGMSLNADRLMTTMLSDYFYMLTGSSSDEHIIIKIPLQDQFQNSYSINDLLIGKVSILGLYKGVVASDSLENTFKFFSSTNKEEENAVINQSTYSEKELEQKNIKNKLKETTYHFIDVIAVLQPVLINKENSK
ncbi:hypothetical protein [Enterococcus italicus]|uniref:hypothetical protein n=1 Tax=Enterococcus italicus TaxID=246144 RepID=UPI003F460564